MSAKADTSEMSMKDWQRASVEERYKKGERDFSGANLCGLDLSGLDLSGADFTRSILVETNFQGANLSECGFYGAEAMWAVFSEATLTRASFSTANLRNTSFSRVNASGVNFIGADLYDSLLSGAILDHARFDGADLSYVTFSRADLHHATLCRATLNATHFKSANLNFATLIEADPCGADFDDVKVNGLRGFYSVRLPYMSSRNDALYGTPFHAGGEGEGTGWSLAFTAGCQKNVTRDFLIQRVKDSHSGPRRAQYLAAITLIQAAFDSDVKAGNLHF